MVKSIAEELAERIIQDIETKPELKDAWNKIPEQKRKRIFIKYKAWIQEGVNELGMFS